MVFEVGDFVLLKNSRQRVGQVKSFEPKFNGPFVVKRVMNKYNFEILNPQDNKTQVVHYDRLIKYKMKKIVKNVAFDDNWRQNRMRLALLIQRNNGNVVVEDPIGEEIPIVHSAETIAEYLELQFSGNEEREPAESETTNESHHSNTTVLHSQHDVVNSNFNRLDEDDEIDEDKEMDSLG
ncbi:hypothetical protein BpHYR1_026950, partial [Brachionus plicatilis]